MLLRLTGTLDQAPFALVLEEGERVLGSDPGCDLLLPHPSVSRRHARLLVTQTMLEIVDLESRNGTFVEGLKISRERVSPGARVRFGLVELALGTVERADLEASVDLPRAVHRDDGAPNDPQTTQALLAADEFVRKSLPVLHQRLSEHCGRIELAQQAGHALMSTLPLLELEILDREAFVFTASRGDPSSSSAQHRVERGAVVLLVRALSEASWLISAPLFDVVASLLHLAGDAPAPLARETTAPALPDPPSSVPAIQKLYADAARVALGDVGVLIHGESGTGKELFARYVHAASTRSAGPFHALNCASLTRDLLEAQLFGVESGVATGVDARPGIFERAHQGTLFLDEIADMSLETQARILRVLQEREVHRIGGSEPRPCNARVIAATNQNLHRAVEAGKFRADLLYRIAGWEAELPPLRARRADIPNLALHFLAQPARERQLDARGISRAAIEKLVAYGWPGNIRQLQTEIARAVLFMAPGQLLDTQCLSKTITDAPPAPVGSTLKQKLEAVERAEIVAAMESEAGDIERVAEVLGVSRSTLYRRVKELGIE